MKLKNIILIFLASYLLYFSNTYLYGQITNTDIPIAIRNVLDKNNPGWQLSDIAIEIYKFFKTSKVKFHPNNINGDFDGNGKIDYTLMITHGDSSYAITFLRKKEGFKKYVLDSHNKEYKDIYLWLFQKGEKDYDYEIGEYFTYENDAIGVMTFEKAGVSFIYKHGEFKKFYTSD